MEGPPTKRYKSLRNCPRSQPSSTFPHSSLTIPLRAISTQETRVLILYPGEIGSLLRASIDVVKLQNDNALPLQQSLEACETEDVDHSKPIQGADRHNDPNRSAENLPIKFVKVGRMLHLVPLGYSGDGNELSNGQNRDTGDAGDTETLAYEAISYVWGDPAYSHKIELEGHGLLCITQSLHEALERFRLTSARRRLWADAICINQADNVERSSQVTIMAKIYQQAAGVLVWLGPAQKSDVLAFAAMSLLLDAVPSDYFPTFYEHLGSRLREDNCCRCCSERFEPTQNVMAQALLAIGSVLHRPWFSRLWVVQEVCMSTEQQNHVTVFSGNHHITYAELKDATQTISFDATTRGSLQPFLNLSSALNKQIREVWSQANPLSDWFNDAEEWPPSYLLRSLGSMSLRNCSNPLDRVYAIRSLLKLEDAPTLLPDYSLTAAEVYRNLVLVLLEKFENRSESEMDQPWALLALAGTESSEAAQDNMPSWVPNFNALTSRSRNKIDQYTKIQWIQVPQFYPAPHLFETRFSGPDALQVRSRCFAVIDNVFPDTEYPKFNDVDSRRILEADLTAFRRWYERCLQCLNIVAEDEEVIAHSTTFLAGGCQMAQLPREVEEVEDAVDYSEGWLFPARWPEDPNIVREHFMLLCATESSPPDKFRRIARIDVAGKKDFCWIPPQARPGDQVCIVAGATFPFVVRKLSQIGFAVLGDACLANTTLKQALGGGGKSRFEEDLLEEIDHPPTDDWNADDETMQKLIAELEWMTLR